MFATITRAARTTTAVGAFDAPTTLAWRTVGASWTIWVSGWVLGTSTWYWGALLVLSALWTTVAAVDRLRSYSAVSRTTAAVLRSFLLGMAMVWAPRALLSPTADLAAWTSVVLTAIAAHFLAPWMGDRGGRHELWRWWNDVKLAAAAGGGVVFAAVLLSFFAAQLGAPVGEEQFIGVLAGAVFCAVPTALSLRATR